MKMQQSEALKLDRFRLVAAILVVGIHVAPFDSISVELDYYLTYCIGRIGVPYFLMLTGYFVLSAYQSEQYREKIRRLVLKLGIMYGCVTILYLPINWYAGKLPHGAGEIFRQIFLDGTFYHLWYLPGTVLGCLIVAPLLMRFGLAKTGLVSLVLYIFGLLGDSWYGLTAQIKPLRVLYDGWFHISSYTRNGIFLMPVFLWLGVWMKEYYFNCGLKKVWLGFGISLAAMLGEGALTRNLGWQKHNSMYLFLIPVMLFLFELLRRTSVRFVKGNPQSIRRTAMWIYLLHPLCIVVIRGLAGVCGMEAVLTGLSLLFYVLVLLSAVVAAIICTWVEANVKEKINGRKGQGVDRT